jgi:hypothetical protein
MNAGCGRFTRKGNLLQKISSLEKRERLLEVYASFRTLSLPQPTFWRRFGGGGQPGFVETIRGGWR